MTEGGGVGVKTSDPQTPTFTPLPNDDRSLIGRLRSSLQPSHARWDGHARETHAPEASAAGARLTDPALHVELAVEVRRVRVAVLNPDPGKELGQHLDVRSVQLGPGHTP